MDEQAIINLLELELRISAADGRRLELEIYGDVLEEGEMAEPWRSGPPERPLTEEEIGERDAAREELEDFSNHVEWLEESLVPTSKTDATRHQMRAEILALREALRFCGSEASMEHEDLPGLSVTPEKYAYDIAGYVCFGEQYKKKIAALESAAEME